MVTPHSPNQAPEEIQQTACYAMHVAAGAKMVDFANYSMPVQYPNGIIAEHKHTRSKAGLFDVSHMGQIFVSGDKAATELETLVPVDVAALAINQQCYTVFTNSSGGIEDDLIITRRDDVQFMLVVNAACKWQDLEYLQQHLARSEVNYRSDWALLALQGPEAHKVLSKVEPAIDHLSFMHGLESSINGVECFISRSGYTGEDGFEISMPNIAAPGIAQTLLEDSAVQWVGLGARDSLRLEAGLCLYGHDMDSGITPIEAGLGWSISAVRKTSGDKLGGFPGADNILTQLAEGPDKKRVGFLVEGRAPVREGAEIIDSEGNKIGLVTSGGFAPGLNRPIAMGYLERSFANVDTVVQAMVRGKARPMLVSKMPFEPHKYVRK